MTISAYQVKVGDTLADGRKVLAAAIHERNEWLTVHIALDDGTTLTPAFYSAVALCDESHTAGA